MLLTQWAGDRGEVGSEYRFYLLEEGCKQSSLVPDVAYYSFERMPPELGEARETPTIAPDIAAEILSPDDRARRSAISESILRLYSTRCERRQAIDGPFGEDCPSKWEQTS